MVMIIPVAVLLLATATAQDDVTTLSDIQQALAKAWVDRDRATIERLIAPEWRTTGPDGRTSDRAAVLAEVFERRRHTITRLQIDDVRVVVFGDAAVVTGRTQGAGEYAGVPYDVVLQFTDTFVRHKGHWAAVSSHASQVATSRQAQSPVEEIYIARSLRESRSAPSAFCSAERTGFDNSQYEDRYTFRSVATRTSDGRVTDPGVQAIGHLRGCVGQTADALVANFYAEGQLAGLPLTAAGQCRAPRADHPESGTMFMACSFELRNLPSPYVSGHLTTSTMNSRQAVGGVSDPAGYVQPSIATVRLWKKR